MKGNTPGILRSDSGRSTMPRKSSRVTRLWSKTWNTSLSWSGFTVLQSRMSGVRRPAKRTPASGSHCRHIQDEFLAPVRRNGLLLHGSGDLLLAGVHPYFAVRVTLPEKTVRHSRTRIRFRPMFVYNCIGSVAAYSFLASCTAESTRTLSLHVSPPAAAMATCAFYLLMLACSSLCEC